ncbi:olfactory receptor 1-like [Polypterus senegalus]|uniref:olfactory receptor 1-like n=1 Tax=Polypterus senegalus TaxID=55291 RepID=UPI001965B32C|nr:olfactory receptor 1-like [Polypterus senegalus]
MSLANNTLMHPEMFYISGFYDMPFANCYYVFLLVLYIFTVFFNGFVILLIYLEQMFHNPKYIAVCHLALVDLCTTTSLTPKLIDTFLFNSNFITYNACLANMFFVHFFTSVQSLSLVMLAYDRFIAICLPLHYHSINTNSRMMLIILSFWLLTVGTSSISVLLITRLSFCRSTVVNSFFCDNGPVFRLACNDVYPNLIMGFISIALFLFMPLMIILISYIAIGITLLKIATAEGRHKALKTCTSHIMLVAMYYIPLAYTYFAGQFASISYNTRILNNTLCTTVPPMMNPVIYTLKTEEMMDLLKQVLRKKKVKTRRTFEKLPLEDKGAKEAQKVALDLDHATLDRQYSRTPQEQFRSQLACHYNTIEHVV